MRISKKGIAVVAVCILVGAFGLALMFSTNRKEREPAADIESVAGLPDR